MKHLAKSLAHSKFENLQLCCAVYLHFTVCVLDTQLCLTL